MACTQKTACGHECGRPHHASMSWPGREPQPVCFQHLARARSIAEHMGFELTFLLTPAGAEFERAAYAVLASGGSLRDFLAAQEPRSREERDVTTPPRITRYIASVVHAMLPSKGWYRWTYVKRSPRTHHPYWTRLTRNGSGPDIPDWDFRQAVLRGCALAGTPIPEEPKAGDTVMLRLTTLGRAALVVYDTKEDARAAKRRGHGWP